MGSKPKKLSAQEFAAIRKNPRGGGCKTCQGRWAPLVKEVLEIWASSGDGYYNWKDLHRWLMDNYEYPYGYDAMWGHIKKHERALMEAIQDGQEKAL